MERVLQSDYYDANFVPEIIVGYEVRIDPGVHE